MSESEGESNVESQESKSSRKRKAYSIEKKLEAIDYAKKHKSKNSASKKFGIGRATEQDWSNKNRHCVKCSKCFNLLQFVMSTLFSVRDQSGLPELDGCK